VLRTPWFLGYVLFFCFFLKKKLSPSTPPPPQKHIIAAALPSEIKIKIQYPRTHPPPSLTYHYSCACKTIFANADSSKTRASHRRTARKVKKRRTQKGDRIFIAAAETVVIPKNNQKIKTVGVLAQKLLLQKSVFCSSSCVVCQNLRLVQILPINHSHLAHPPPPNLKNGTFSAPFIIVSGSSLTEVRLSSSIGLSALWFDTGCLQALADR
jgi:hypothetical protein